MVNEAELGDAACPPGPQMDCKKYLKKYLNISQNCPLALRWIAKISLHIKNCKTKNEFVAITGPSIHWQVWPQQVRLYPQLPLTNYFRTLGTTGDHQGPPMTTLNSSPETTYFSQQHPLSIRPPSGNTNTNSKFCIQEIKWGAGRGGDPVERNVWEREQLSFSFPAFFTWQPHYHTLPCCKKCLT